MSFQMKAAAYKVVVGATRAQVVQPTYRRPCRPPLRTRALPLGRATLELAVEAGRGVAVVVAEGDGPAISSPSISRLVCTGSHNPSKTSFPKHSVTLSSHTQGCLCPTGPPL